MCMCSWIGSASHGRLQDSLLLPLRLFGDTACRCRRWITTASKGHSLPLVGLVTVGMGVDNNACVSTDGAAVLPWPVDLQRLPLPSWILDSPPS